MFCYPSVSCSDFKVSLTQESGAQDPNENVAAGKNVVVKNRKHLG